MPRQVYRDRGRGMKAIELAILRHRTMGEHNAICDRHERPCATSGPVFANSRPSGGGRIVWLDAFKRSEAHSRDWVAYALGAQGTNVQRCLVMREVLLLVGAGTAVSFPVAWALARLFESQLYAISPTMPHQHGIRGAALFFFFCFWARWPWPGACSPARHAHRPIQGAWHE